MCLRDVLVEAMADVNAEEELKDLSRNVSRCWHGTSWTLTMSTGGW